MEIRCTKKSGVVSGLVRTNNQCNSDKNERGLEEESLRNVKQDYGGKKVAQDNVLSVKSKPTLPNKGRN